MLQKIYSNDMFEHNYFNSSIKLLSDLYLAKLNTPAKPFRVFITLVL